MTLRALICDVYKTLLEVTPPASDRDARWTTLMQDATGAAPRHSLAEFTHACERVVAREHADARAAGIPFPEIYWPDVAREVLPEINAFKPAALDDFLVRQQTLFRTVRLMPGAAATLQRAQAHGLLLGLASNAQPYTLRELGGALAESGLGLGLFTPALCFWSFEQGFSKPDPHVFRLLTARLRGHGIAPAQTLMVGDRLDNDIHPAQAQGWRTWHLAAAPAEGGWAECMEYISAHA